jgi:hypothetical protein
MIYQMPIKAPAVFLLMFSDFSTLPILQIA